MEVHKVSIAIMILITMMATWCDWYECLMDYFNVKDRDILWEGNVKTTWWADYIGDFEWRLHFQYGVVYWKVVLREVYIWRANSRLKGIEDLNLQHCLGSRRMLLILSRVRVLSSVKFIRWILELMNVIHIPHRAFTYYNRPAHWSEKQKQNPNPLRWRGRLRGRHFGKGL